jgi:VIT1/CCC1 family predicted Fe2+/Mn2+ transporter
MSDPGRVREELEAAVAARRELGDELEPHVIDSFVGRIERRIDQRIDERLGPHLAKRQSRSDDKQFVMALVSLGVAIPLTAIAISNGGLVALAIVWVGIVLVNLAFARR